MINENSSPSGIRSLHVHDAAGVGADLVQTASEMGLSWRQVPIPSYYSWRWPGPLQHMLVRGRRFTWDAELAVRSGYFDVVHVHTGGLAPHARWLRSPWVLHLHGTDIRTRQYEPTWKEKIEFGLQHADRIVFSTPDLGEHLERFWHKTSYLPLTVRSDTLPQWTPVRGRVIFASRWDDVKGASEQIEIARQLHASNPLLELLGLNWGQRAFEAAAAGVRLVPRMNQIDYIRWLASGSVVVGQASRILSLSEMQALGIGAPLISSFDQSFYPLLRRLNVREDLGSCVAAIQDALDDPVRAARAQEGQRYIADNHDPRVGVEKLLGIYRSIV